MFGILGGLLGGALRGGIMRAGGGGGVLSGLMSRRRSGGGGGSSMSSYSAQAPKAAPVEQEQPEASGPTQAPRAQEPTPQQPREAPMVQEASKDLAAAAPQMQQQQAQQNPIRGLLDDTTPAAEPPKAETDKPPQPPSIVNRTETLSPVAPQQSELAGSTPQLQQTDTLQNKIFDSGANRQVFEYQEGNPDKTFDTGGSEWTPPMGLSYQQSTTVASSSPARRYRSF